ncbi:hypothetical protein AX774_g4299 [Zancudomyces culisetae]|uniref:Uncharacterized protein n=1 Tax=Zancudomyces culisetae TaxID=1213189 RepID=A0A1R1PK01_ZANCU|nr:hypothetical protein AX774_g5244 [Zancudomyces culisetae]OMH82228.1 hypothetical protein AX774_g4299 [Zancudomyces culisetae]|eukprot:OMH81300.1 hypothetical protein AX774_g5244 [Zancudomyces culisetae]
MSKSAVDTFVGIPVEIDKNWHGSLGILKIQVIDSKRNWVEILQENEPDCRTEVAEIEDGGVFVNTEHHANGLD